MEIFLKRPHQEVPWGFRIIGGSDSHLPIIVSKVIENSIAEKSGLEEDVLVERINNIPTSGLTHAEVNNIILAADNEILFTVKRENLENLILASINDEDNNLEITRILREAVNKEKIAEADLDTEEELLGLRREFGETMIIDNTSQVKEGLNVSGQRQSYATSLLGKKWSTFLQKPKNPPPRLKNQVTIPKADQYRVIIKKQIKQEKSQPATQDSKEIFEERKEEHDIEERDIEEHENCPEVEQNTDEQISEETEIAATEKDNSVNQYLETGITEEESVQENIEPNVVQNTKQNEMDEVDELEVNFVAECTVVENVLSLEEQLAAVQKQLQELAQLPSSIQETLSIVTQQLANIVGEQNPQIEEKEEENRDETLATNTNDEENQGENIVQEGGNDEELVEEVSETAMMEDSQSEVLSDICEEQEVPEIDEEKNHQELLENSEDELTEQKNFKTQMDQEQMLQEEEEKVKKPIVRPIILPGGRKWADEEDALPKIKNPKMSDDKINNTLETFAEVIVGRTKGINFLKYTPPLKNLDYLQRSEVYRLVHDMEPPVKGISIRSEKILAEQDYYTAGGY